jgi:hypothetical protein
LLNADEGEAMSRLNTRDLGPRTHQAGPADYASPEAELRRLVLASVAEVSQSVAGSVVMAEIAELVPKVAAERVAALALEARKAMKLRHISLLLVCEMARHKTHRRLVADTLASVIRRPDDLTDFVAVYWKDGRVPLSGQVKKGLAAAFPKFTEQELAGCERGGAIELRDVLFLSHAKPRDAVQAGVWKKLIWRRLKRSRKSV